MLSLARPWGHAIPWGLREREACKQAEPGLSLYRPLLRKPNIALRAKERRSVRNSVHYGKSRYQTGNKLVIGIHPKAWSCRGILLEGALVREKAQRHPRAGRKQLINPHPPSSASALLCRPSQKPGGKMPAPPPARVMQTPTVSLPGQRRVWGMPSSGGTVTIPILLRIRD